MHEHEQRGCTIQYMSCRSVLGRIKYVKSASFTRQGRTSISSLRSAQSSSPRSAGIHVPVPFQRSPPRGSSQRTYRPVSRSPSRGHKQPRGLCPSTGCLFSSVSAGDQPVPPLASWGYGYGSGSCSGCDSDRDSTGLWKTDSSHY
jgi:hypothetical protein